MKTKEKKKVKKPQVSYHKKPADLTLEQWQTELRKQFAQQSEFNIRNMGEHPVFSNFDVKNPKSKTTYKVRVRGTTGNGNTCTCMDFKTNELGTCKHIEAVLHNISRKVSWKILLDKGMKIPYSEVVVDYCANRKVKFVPGEKTKEGFVNWIKNYFDKENYLRRESIEEFENFANEAGKKERGIVIQEDVYKVVLATAEKKRRQDQLKKLFPRGENSGTFKTLVKATLLPYQKQGVLFAANAGRCLIADEMGLGKTIQAIAAAEALRKINSINTILIVCPTSLKYQWKSEIEKFTDEKALVIEGNYLQRELQYKNDAPYKIVSYNSAGNDIGNINKSNTGLVILDEAQRIKNWKTKIAANVKKLDAEFAFVLTGTPLENKLEELYSIVQFVDPYRLGALFRFIHNHSMFDDSGKILGYKGLNQIGEFLSDILIRRTKKSVRLQLPGRLDKTLFVPMTEQQMAIHYENSNTVAQLGTKWRRYGFLTEQERLRFMAALSAMRMSCDSTFLFDEKSRDDTKIDELICILEEYFIENPDSKAVVFSQWERMTRIVGMELEERGIGFQSLNGRIPGKDRGKLIDKFKNDSNCKVFLSTDAGGVGLNLQNASLVVNLDLPWNPAVLEQRIGRVYRMGQKKVVNVINMVSQNTIEERMLGVLSFKSALSGGVLDVGEDTILISDSKFNQLVKTVEALTENIPSATVPQSPAENENSKEEFTNDPSTGSGTEKEIPIASVAELMSDEEKTTITKTENGNSVSAVAGDVQELIKSGTDFLSKLRETLSSPEKTNAFVQSLTGTDPQTGEMFIKIPVKDQNAVVNLVGMLGKLFGGL